MKEVTIEQVLSFGPCPGYQTREELLAISGGRESMPLLDILRMEQIPAPDKLWMALRPEFISEKDLRLLACKWAEEVQPIFEREYPDDKRPRQAIAVARLFAEGKATIEELDAVRAAAGSVANSAAWDADGFAAGDAAREKQLADVIKLLENQPYE